jgi:hypothetical protein
MQNIVIRIVLKIFLISSFLSTTSNANDQLYFKIGLWDFKHETGGLALNIKKVSNKNLNILNLGELTQIYEFTGFTDKKNYFSKGKEVQDREEQAIYLSTGLQKTLNLSKNLSLVPSFSVGLYEAFDAGKDMGFPIEFKSEIELNRSFSNGSLFGVTYNHISNADIGDTNPGSDSILINFKKNF